MNRSRADTGAPVLDIAVPVYNEERVLEQSVGALYAFVHAAHSILHAHHHRRQRE